MYLFIKRVLHGIIPRNICVVSGMVKPYNSMLLKDRKVTKQPMSLDRMANPFKGANTHLINVHVIIGAIVAVDIVVGAVIVVGDVTIAGVMLPKLQKNEAIMKMIKRNLRQKKSSPDVVIEVEVEGVEATVVEAEDEAVGVVVADHIIVDVPAVKVQEMNTHHKMKAAVMRMGMKK